MPQAPGTEEAQGSQEASVDCVTDEIMRNSRLPLSMVALHNTPRHSRESDYMGLLSPKKKIPRGVCAPLWHAD